MKSTGNLGQAERLKRARIEAKYATAAEAAAALGVKPGTYTHHENGTAGLSRNGKKYARFYRVDFDWLMTGEGAMRPAAAAASISLVGRVAAGERAEDGGDAVALTGEVELPTRDGCDAWVVSGDSMRPRFFRGEILLFDRKPTAPEKLVGQFCRVQALDGASYVKILRRGNGRFWALDSIHADVAPIDDVDVFAAFRWQGLLPSPNLNAFTVARPERPRRRKT